MNILILGKGLLGSAVFDFLTHHGYTVQTNTAYWPSKEFKDQLRNFEGICINCIGSIPQKTKDFRVNYELPEFLGGLSNIKVIHPGTDCEIDDSPYGISKAVAADICQDYRNIKIIKTSIIGFDKDKASLLSWSLAQTAVDGYVDAYWNGVTTLKWAEKCLELILNWDKFGKTTVITSKCVSKFELLKTIYKVFGRDVEVNPVSGKGKNKCLVGEYVGEIEEMLVELKEFYGIEG